MKVIFWLLKEEWQTSFYFNLMHASSHKTSNCFNIGTDIKKKSNILEVWWVFELKRLTNYFHYF